MTRPAGTPIPYGYGRMELRTLRYFVAVAEELHFGRAATRLHMSQPPLSRAIKQLETDVGAALLHRSTAGVTLTPAGAVLLDEARALLDQADRVRVRVAAAAGAATLTVGILGDSADPGAIRLAAAYRRRHPGVEVRIRETDLTDPTCGLRAGLRRLRLPLRRPHPRCRQARHRNGHPRPARPLPAGQGRRGLRQERVLHRLEGPPGALPGRTHQQQLEPRPTARQGRHRGHLRRHNLRELSPPRPVHHLPPGPPDAHPAPPRTARDPHRRPRRTADRRLQGPRQAAGRTGRHHQPGPRRHRDAQGRSPRLSSSSHTLLLTAIDDRCESSPTERYSLDRT